jgi:hypothetical protein
MQLFFLEQRLLNQIACSFEYSFEQVNKVYKSTCSFDKTIQILDHCRNSGMDLTCINEALELLVKSRHE